MNILVIAILGLLYHFTWEGKSGLNFYVFTLAVMFLIHQNQYFGWNKEPHSDAELMADGITFLLFALAFLGNSVSISINRS